VQYGVGGNTEHVELDAESSVRLFQIVVTWETLEKEAPKQGRGFRPWTKINLWAIHQLEKVKLETVV
jgi:hypothetical protein